ncbi:hypothetical protein Tco_1417512 [Tanacetum coccineum]
MSLSPHSTIIPSDSDIEDAFSSTNILNYFLASSGNIFPKSSKISSLKDTKTPVESPIPISSLVRSSSSMPPKRTSTSATPAMTQDAIWKLVADSVAAALEAQAANMANTDNTNKNTGTSGTPVARKGTNDHK